VFGSINLPTTSLITEINDGVPSLSFGFSGPQGVYHSIYDSFTWMEYYGDPGFYYHKLAAQLFGSLTIAFTEATLAPLNYTDTAAALSGYLITINNSLSGYPPNSVNLTQLQDAVNEFNVKATANAKQINTSFSRNLSSSDVKKFNAQLYSTERQFLDSVGLPLRYWYKHTIQAPGITKGYGSDVFPGLAWAIQSQNWSLAANQVQRISLRVQAASSNVGKNPLAQSNDDSSDDINLGLILGLVLGIGFLVAFIIFIVYRRHRRQESVMKTNLGQGYDALAETT